MPAERIHRLLRLITLLQRDEPNTTESLMSDLGVSRRTLFRDLQILEASGVPYRHDRDQGYRLDRNFYLPPINLTVPETLGLMMLGKYAASQLDRPLARSALSAIYKLIATTPDPIRQACTELMANVSFAPDVRPEGDKETRFHTLLQRCIDQGRSCRFVYQCPVEDQALHAMLDPYLLHFVNRAWYVLGYVDVYDEVRMLKLVRFVELEPTDERFDKPENYRASDKLGNAWRLIPEGKEHQIVLVFSAKVATNVSEVRWHPSQKQEILDDGRCVMRFTIDGLNEIAWWVCGYADQVQVIKPPELRDRVAQMHRAAAKQYEAQPPLEIVTVVKRPAALAEDAKKH